MPSIFKKFTKVEEQQTTSASSLSLPNLNSAYNVFTFHPDNPCNTEIRTSTGRVAYRIDTTTTELNTLTVVRNSFGSVLATLEWKEFLSDRVTLGTGNPMSLNSWLKRSLMPFSTTVSLKDDKGRKYKWDGYAAGLQLELYAEDSPIKSPIARFQRSRRDVESAPAMLLLKDRAMEVQELVVISFVFLEKSRRMMDNAANMLGDIHAAPGAG